MTVFSVPKQLKLIIIKLDNYSGPELGQLCRQHKITNPDTGNEVTEPQEFNLMFTSSIGPTGQHQGYVLSSHKFPVIDTLPQLFAS